MKRSSFINMSNITDVSNNTDKHDDSFNKLSMGLSCVSKDLQKKLSYSKKRDQRQKEEEGIASSYHYCILSITIIILLLR